MKKVFLLLIAALTICSCKDKTNFIEDFEFYFLPRKVSYASIEIGEQKDKIIQTSDGQVITKEYGDINGNAVSQNKMFLSVVGTNVDDKIFRNMSQDSLRYYIYEYVDEHLPNVERLIDNNYRKHSSSGSKSSTKGLYYTYLIEMEYRTTEIRNLVIRSLNTPLFGKAPGESLNDFFDIVKYDPPVIISAPTETLVYGYSSKTFPVAIDEWLSLSPLSSVAMFLVPNKKIEGLPLDVQFVIRMETADGLVLHDTTEMITITP
jgi:hypothetical protein